MPENTAEIFDDITYVPGPQDPNWTIVGANPDVPNSGIKYLANVPQKISRKVKMAQLLKREREMPDGMVRTQAFETMVPMVEVLATNPFFSINGNPPARRIAPAKRVPTDPDQYKNHAIHWIAAASEAGALQAQWMAEEKMRDRLGVTERELQFIMPFFEARQMELAGARTFAHDLDHGGRVVEVR